MKLKQAILVGVALFPLISSAQGRFYVGAQGGVSYLKSTMTANGEANPDSGSIKIKFSKSAFTGGILGGYHKEFENFFLLGEVSGRLGDVNQKKGPLTITDPNTDVDIQTGFAVKFKRQYTVGIAAKLGKFFGHAQKFGAFLNLGILNSRFNVNFIDPDSTPPQSNSQNKNLFGIAPGAGVIYKASEKLVVRADYAYEMYNSFKSKNLDNTADQSLTLKTNPRYHTVLLSISYLFGGK